MSQPRLIKSGSTYMITRRCTQRQFLLRPSDIVNQVFLYTLAYVAKKYSIKVHSFCIMSNHYHIIVTDPDTNILRFIHLLNSIVGRALNVHHKRFECLWSSEKCGVMELVSPEDIIEKTVYTLTNPVKAGLVRFGCEWPGLRNNPGEIGSKVFKARRPVIFLANSTWASVS